MLFFDWDCGGCGVGGGFMSGLRTDKSVAVGEER